MPSELDATPRWLVFTLERRSKLAAKRADETAYTPEWATAVEQYGTPALGDPSEDRAFAMRHIGDVERGRRLVLRRGHDAEGAPRKPSAAVQLACRRCGYRPRIKMARLAALANDAMRRGRASIYV